MARGAKDISVENECLFLMMVNCDPSSPDVPHYHIVGVCQCGGRRKPLRNMCRALRLLVGVGPQLCLIYRWKGLDQAACGCMRGRCMCDVSRRAIAIVLSQLMDVAKALENARQPIESGGRQSPCQSGHQGKSCCDIVRGPIRQAIAHCSVHRPALAIGHEHDIHDRADMSLV